ncbi:MAG: AAA family ATPase [Deltaproteobacteria bacterium]|nr:AAA family ATPase [Deltaproteobacteria bacterium]MBW1738315.1 AAA family ATPase [Deltaproteobacteria bacterium]MBW1907952.1 AAA family ATPase [Deltaproteobacteria bacterium]MBW2033225.1 AAA family ATPase [Deltaproteobacteria bacterium]MBW2113710.1 AAA family ATPase [Deltaproteobacteria bacterium]
MYTSFFGLKERPFKLVPDPAYLFLSKSHEEALAHLSYAISQGDGFVEITGEVGTGKTTLCRVFLANLDEDTEAAYIFNPILNSVQLLKSINDEFGINSEADNTKDLIDTLNAFLIEKKAQGKKAILLIDEAQNLSKEVLEQLRLLSNLETSKYKLLQIILVGQPELAEMLDSYELRQLGQRITLSCYLFPLTYKETKGYIQHRINIATKKSGIKFNRAAFRSIYRYSSGIPRLINITCDRALLTAFGVNRHKITGSIARAAIRELAGRGYMKRYGLYDGKRVVLLLLILCIAFFIILYRPQILNINGMFHASKGVVTETPLPGQAEMKEVLRPAPDSEQISGPGQDDGKPEPDIETVIDLGDVLKDMDTRSSRQVAVKAAMDLWNSEAVIKQYPETIEDDQTFFRLAAKHNGLLIRRVKGDLDLLRRLDLPAILQFHLLEAQSPVYLTLSKMDDSKILLISGAKEQMIEIKPDEVKSYWSGVAYIPWKNFLSLTGSIPLDSPKDSIVTLKMLMRDIGFSDIDMSPVYDELTRKAITEVQQKSGIKVDGVVGPLTKIILYNEIGSLKIPHITN